MTLPERLPAWPNGEQFTRIAWASARAQALWKPRLSAINAALVEIEIASVLHGHRRSALLFKGPEEMPALTADAIAHGCAALVLGIEGTSSSTYSASALPFVAGKPFRFRVAVTRDVEQWKAHAAGDEMAIGRALGYPDCCSQFYQHMWVDGGWRDTTLPMFDRSESMGTPHGNILLRWAGVRMIRHLPCRFDCEQTAWIGRQTEEIGRELGFDEEMDWALEMLSWPMEWSSLHGIAEIKTPVFKISTSTDPLASKAVVRREGDRYPEEGATGLAFPFRQPDSRAVTDSRSFARATGSDEWKQNGFSSAEGMERAHQIVAAVALSAIEPHTRIPSVIDLGCGNGALLDRISRERSDMQPIGIDTDRARVLAASQRLTHGHFTMGDIFETAHWNNDYSIALLMPGRLEEVDDLKALAFRKHLSARAAKVIVYAYDDWLPLTGLCSRVGLEIIPSSLRYAQGVQAAILSDGRTG